MFVRDGRQFEASCAKTLGWLADEVGLLSERLLISADREILQQQVDQHEVSCVCACAYVCINKNVSSGVQ